MSSTLFYSLILFHILGSAVWVGGHLLLVFGYLPEALRSRSIVELQKFENKFEQIGILALVVQILTGLALAYRMSPDWTQWFSPDSGLRGIGIKLFLLLSTAGLAVDARFRIIPKLNPNNLNSLAWHIIPVTIIGVLFVVVGVFFRIGGI